MGAPEAQGDRVRACVRACEAGVAGRCWKNHEQARQAVDLQYCTGAAAGSVGSESSAQRVAGSADILRCHKLARLVVVVPVDAIVVATIVDRSDRCWQPESVGDVLVDERVEPERHDLVANCEGGPGLLLLDELTELSVRWERLSPRARRSAL